MLVHEATVGGLLNSGCKHPMPSKQRNEHSTSTVLCGKDGSGGSIFMVFGCSSLLVLPSVLLQDILRCLFLWGVAKD